MSKYPYSRAIAIVTLLGVILSCLSLYEYAAQISGVDGRSSFCNINATFNCDAVNASAYSKLFGLPLASFGLAFYLFFLIWNFRTKDSEERKDFISILFLTTIGSLVFSAYLFYISKFVIGTICIFCVGLYIINAFLFIFAYRARQPEINTFSRAVYTIVKFPKTLFSPAAGENIKSVMIYGAAVACSFGAPFLITEYIKSQPAKSRPSELSEWQKKPVINFQINDSNSVFADHRKGSAQAPITIVEFFDYQCGACRILHEKIQNIFDQHKDSVSFVAKNYPLDKTCNKNVQHEMHKHACFAASVARCAGEQGKFWEVHDLLMTLDALESESSQDVVKRKVWLSLDELGVDTAAVHDCVESGRHLEKIRSEVDEGTAAKIQGTPSLFINGRFVEATKVESILAALTKKQPSS